MIICEALTGLAHALFDLGKYNEALEAADRALKIDPTQAGSWIVKSHTENYQEKRIEMNKLEDICSFYSALNLMILIIIGNRIELSDEIKREFDTEI